MAAVHFFATQPPGRCPSGGVRSTSWKVPWKVPYVAVSALAIAGLGAAAVSQGISTDTSEAVFTKVGNPASTDDDIEDSLAALTRYAAVLTSGTNREHSRAEVLHDRLTDAIGEDGEQLVSVMLESAASAARSAATDDSRAEKLSAAVSKVNDFFERRGFGYYIDTDLTRQPRTHEVVAIAIVGYAIREVVEYRTAAGDFRALRVERVDGQDDRARHLGAASPDSDEVTIVMASIDNEIRTGLLKAMNPDEESTLFYMKGADGGAWYPAMREHIAGVLRDELRVGVEQRAAVVEDHEMQHMVDFRTGLQRPLGLESFTPYIEDPWMIAATTYEASAYLAQIARDYVQPRVGVIVIASYLFTPKCVTADCFAALLILDELALELEPSTDLVALTSQRSYTLEDVSSRLVALTSHTAEDVRDAAGRAYKRMFDRPVPFVQRLHIDHE